MFKHVLPLAVMFVFVCSVANVRAADAKMAGKDSKFIHNAAIGGQMEVDLGKLAAEKASSGDVKKFGQTMVDDHSKANEELKSLASSKGVDLTKAMDNAMKKSESAKKKLEEKSGSDFDKAYMKDMVEDHEKDVAEFKKAQSTVKDPDLKAWVDKTLPVIEGHLKMAQDINKKLK